MKKALSAFLMAGLLLSNLTSCGGGDKPPQQNAGKPPRVEENITFTLQEGQTAMPATAPITGSSAPTMRPEAPIST